MIDFKLLIEKALKLGFSDVEIVEKSSKSLEVSLFRSVVDQNVLSEDNSISIRAMYNDKMANMSIENFDCDLDEVLNRLKSPKDIDRIKKDVGSGKIDLICGTHKLLASDIDYKNLGLLILDEEQKFGVADKEKIKNFKKSSKCFNS